MPGFAQGTTTIDRCGTRCLGEKQNGLRMWPKISRWSDELQRVFIVDREWSSIFAIWMFPKIGVPPNHPFQEGFPLSIIHFGVPLFLEWNSTHPRSAINAKSGASREPAENFLAFLATSIDYGIWRRRCLGVSCNLPTIATFVPENVGYFCMLDGSV